MKPENFLKSILIILTMGVLFSCENSLEKVMQISSSDTLALLTADSIDFFRSDSGRLQMELKAPLMRKFGGKNPYTDFPKGFYVVFYDTSGQLVSRISANYGINLENENRLEARNNVIIYNFKTKEQLNTESLVWDKRKKEIFSHAFVKITTPDKVIFGDSIWANESFSKRKIYGVRATIEVEEDSTSDY